MRRFFSVRRMTVLIVLLALVIGIGAGFAVAAETIDLPTIRVAVDQQGHMRLLSSELKGSFNTEPRPNEFEIELLSNDSILALQELLNTLQIRIGDLESRVSNDQELLSALQVRIDDLESTVNNSLESRLSNLETDIATLYNMLDDLPSRVGDLETDIATLYNMLNDLPSRLSDLESRVSALESNSGGSGNNNNEDFINDSSLVLYLPLYELQGTSFVSMDTYGHTCTVTGATWTPTGRSFDGTDDSIEIAAHSALDIVDDITIEAWVRVDSSVDGTIFSDQFHGGRGKGWWFAAYLSTGGAIRFNGGGNAGTILNCTDIASNITGHFVHLVAVRDGTEMSIWRNGLKSGTTGSLSGSISLESTRPIRIGCREKTTVPLAGYIGEVRVYNRALTPAEILHNYQVTMSRYQ